MAYRVISRINNSGIDCVQTTNTMFSQVHVYWAWGGGGHNQMDFQIFIFTITLNSQFNPPDEREGHCRSSQNKIKSITFNHVIICSAVIACTRIAEAHFLMFL